MFLGKVTLDDHLPVAFPVTDDALWRKRTGPG